MRLKACVISEDIEGIGHVSQLLCTLSWLLAKVGEVSSYIICDTAECVLHWSILECLGASCLPVRLSRRFPQLSMFHTCAVCLGVCCVLPCTSMNHNSSLTYLLSTLPRTCVLLLCTSDQMSVALSFIGFVNCMFKSQNHFCQRWVCFGINILCICVLLNCVYSWVL